MKPASALTSLPFVVAARLALLLLVAAAWVGAAAIVLGAFFAIAFDAAFAAFHALFFAAGTWQFGPDSNLLRLFPQPFWFEGSLVAGATIVVAALIAAFVGRRDLRAAAGAGWGSATLAAWRLPSGS